MKVVFENNEQEDTIELIRRIYEYGQAYDYIGLKKPLFRLTPYEHRIFVNYLRFCFHNFKYEVIGELPTFMGVNFELVGDPILFNGKHIRSDSGIL